LYLRIDADVPVRGSVRSDGLAALGQHLSDLSIRAFEPTRRFGPLAQMLKSLRCSARSAGDTRLIISEMQGFCEYSPEMKIVLIGLTAGIRRFRASLRSA